MLKKLILVVLSAVMCIDATSQTVSGASRKSGLAASGLRVGGSYIFAYPDYSPQKANGFGMFFDYSFMRHYGLTFDYHRIDISQHADSETSYEYGALYHRTYTRVDPFVRGFAGRGAYHFGDPDHSNPSSEGFNVAQGGNTTGYTLVGFAGGADLKLNDHLSFRVEGDYQHWFAGANLENGLTPILYSVGVGYHFGQDPGKVYPPEMGCRATPTYIFPGDPIRISSNVINVRDTTGLTYTWSTSVGHIDSQIPGSDVEISTSGVAPGEYVVKGRLFKQRGRREIAYCEALFTVREFEPPTVACSANPSSAIPGTDITISATGVSPQNRSLTYSYTTASGTLRAMGPTAVLSTNGLPTGPVAVTCNATDDLGHSVSSTVTVAITTLPSPVVAKPQPLCSVSFQRDSARPTRVDNEGKACLDDIALKMKASIESHLIIVGNYARSETSYSAAERAMNAKRYLINEQHIDPSRIEARVGIDGSKTLNDILIPLGAVFSDPTTKPFNEKLLVQHGEAYGRP